MRPYSGETEDPDQEVSWGPWRIPEPLGTINNIFACVYNVVTLFWSFWPQTNDPTAETTNWSVLPFCVVILFSIIWYPLQAKKHYKGPIREV